MATHKSAIKRAAQSRVRNERNRALRTALRGAIKKFRALVEAKDAAQLVAAYPVVQRSIDKARTKGLIHKNTASRYKARLAAAMKKAQAA
jgi:small subunit ribosomal protein S20